MRRLLHILGLLGALAATPVAAATLTVEGSRFVLTTDAGQRLTSEQLVGAVLDMTDPNGRPIRARIDAVRPAKERAATLLHDLSVQLPDGSFAPMCEPDAYGRKSGFPVPGQFDADGRYSRPPGKWFLTCTSGSQAKCILWGYDPASRGPGGEDLGPFYQACQNMVRAAYDGRGVAHTRDGTSIDLWDVLRIQVPDSTDDPKYKFEAGWGTAGAVCVAHTRIPDILPLDVLLKSAPQLRASPCDEAEARRRGALIFNRSKG
ncbi:ADYC domain-containing protein [Glacieibacterium frigidum]|uniref:ADYC domain-containing protein n=1 Tax=Glacieibacterium frigidum TaxID=2593303 RepID=A0A552UHE0_9SPHN|nr:ADYC domain-containing protein [Glacieibacterium frigidum]TRW17638.1 hypothetical protein FMM06_05680 [Glacieibacterium frigidum]